MIKYVCSKCGKVLYTFPKPKVDKRGLISLKVFANMYRRCPFCGKRLSKKPLKVEVRCKR